MFTKRPLPLTDFLTNLETFDLVLMHGVFPSSLILEELEGSTWSHVGVAVIAGDLIDAGLPLPGIDPHERLFWESNVIAPAEFTHTPQINDVLANAPKNGPQLTRLIDRMTFNIVNRYDDQFAARKLMWPRTPAMVSTLADLIRQVHPDLFPMTADGQYGDMANFQLGRFENKPGMKDTFFCSQLAAHTYQNLGLLTRQYVDNSYAPADFSEILDVSLLGRAWLGRETWLDATTLPTAFPVAPVVQSAVL